MRESILTSIKKLLGIAEENTDFDVDIVVHINTVLMILRQMGVGPVEGFMVVDYSETWSDFLGADNIVNFAAVKSYVFLKVQNLFDPTANGTVAQSRTNLISELEYRLYTEAAWPTNK